MMCSCGDGGNADTTFCLLAINHIMLRPGKRQVSGK